jgi:hypothetical protein
MNVTKYRNLSNEELLSVAAERDRSGSDLLQELINRLEKLEAIESRADVNERVECPCCQANLLVEFDPHNNLYEVKVDKDV